MWVPREGSISEASGPSSFKFSLTEFINSTASSLLLFLRHTSFCITMAQCYTIAVLFDAPQIPAGMHPFHWIPQDSTGFQWNGTGIQQSEPRFHWIVTEGTCISACKYKCVYINRLCSLSVSLSLSGYPLPFLGQISHNTMIVALSLTFLTTLKSSYLVLFSWGKMQKGWKKSLMRNILYLISPQWEHFKT